jgi:hypothetical protein
MKNCAEAAERLTDAWTRLAGPSQGLEGHQKGGQQRGWGEGTPRAWRRAQDLLRAGVDGVDAPLVGKHGHAAQRAHCVHQQQRPVLVAQLAQARHVLVHARAALALRATNCCFGSPTSSLPDFIVDARHAGARLPCARCPATALKTCQQHGSEVPHAWHAWAWLPCARPSCACKA